MGRRPARHPPPAAAARRALGRGDRRSRAALVHRLVRAGVALHVAHTNADAPTRGSRTRSRTRSGSPTLRPLVAARRRTPLDKLVTFVPEADAERVVDALAAAGAGRASATTRGAPGRRRATGTFTPARRRATRRSARSASAEQRRRDPGRDGAAPRPAAGGRRRRAARRAPLRGAGVRRARAGVAGPAGRGPAGSGGWPAPATLRRVRRAGRGRPCRRPRRASGWRATRTRRVARVAVCGGAGDDLFDAVRAAGADAYVTADLRHHPASEARERTAGAPAWSTSRHWASEWPWLADGGRLLAAASARGRLRWRRASRTLVTDPWTAQPRAGRRRTDDGRTAP